MCAPLFSIAVISCTIENVRSFTTFVALATALATVESCGSVSVRVPIGPFSLSGNAHLPIGIRPVHEPLGDTPAYRSPPLQFPNVLEVTGSGGHHRTALAF